MNFNWIILTARIKGLLLSLICFFVVGLGNSSAQSLFDGLVYLYNFSGEAVDESGNGLDPTIHGASLAEDRFGNPNWAYQFDGDEDYMDIPYSNLIQIDPPVSFAFWVNAENFNSDTMKFFCTDATTLDYHGYRMHGAGSNDGKIMLTVGSGQGGTGPTNRRTKISDSTITLGNWHHIAGVVRTGTDMDIYIDCEDAAGSYSGSGTLFPGHSGSSGRIGSILVTSWFNLSYFKGKIDQMGMWNRELSAGDVSKICDGHFEPKLTSINHLRVNPKVLVRYVSGTDNIEVILNGNHGKVIKMELLTINGQLISGQMFHDQRSTLSAEGLSNGVYLVRIQSKTNQFVKRISIFK
jgi:hypothetical protein